MNHQLLEYLRWNSFRSESNKLFYVATPKAACTTFKWWFAELEGFAESIRTASGSGEVSPELAIHDLAPAIAPRVTYLTEEALGSILESSEYFRFAIVRNPYQRLFSAWQSKLLLREPVQFQKYAGHQFVHLPIQSRSDIRRAFEAFVEHLALNESPNFIDHHWAPQADLIRPDIVRYAIVAKLEEPSELISRLSHQLGRLFENPLLASSNNASLLPYSTEFVSDKAQALIRTIYATDFEQFSYSMDPPEGRTRLDDPQLKTAITAIEMLRARHQRFAEVRGEVSALAGKLSELHEQSSALTDLRSQLARERKSIVELEVKVDEMESLLVVRIYRKFVRFWRRLKGHLSDGKGNR